MSKTHYERFEIPEGLTVTDHLKNVIAEFNDNQGKKGQLISAKPDQKNPGYICARVKGGPQ